MRAIAALLTAALGLWPLATPAAATVLVYNVLDSHGKVFIAHSSNHGYYPRSRDFRYRHIVNGLYTVRRRLLAGGQIRDLPIAISFPPALGGPEHESTQIALKKSGYLGGGEGGDYRPLGAHYAIYVAEENADSYQNLLALVVALQKLTEKNPLLEVPDGAALRRALAPEIEKFRGVTRYHHPMRSPNGRFVLSTIWTDGDLRFVVTNTQTKAVRKLEPLEGYMATYPRWSPDSRRVAYASLRQVKLFDVGDHRTHTIPLPIPDANEVFLAFDRSGDRLVFAADAAYFSGYQIYRYDCRRSSARLIVSNAARPAWGTPLPGRAALSVAQRRAAAMEVERLATGGEAPPSKDVETGTPSAPVVPTPGKQPPSGALSDRAPLLAAGGLLVLLVGIAAIALSRRRRR